MNMKAFISILIVTLLFITNGISVTGEEEQNTDAANISETDAATPVETIPPIPTPTKVQPPLNISPQSDSNGTVPDGSNVTSVQTSVPSDNNTMMEANTLGNDTAQINESTPLGTILPNSTPDMNQSPRNETSSSYPNMSPPAEINNTLNITNRSEVVDPGAKQKAFSGWLEIGMNASLSKNYKAASEAFVAALRINNGSDEARIRYAISLSKLGRSDEARAVMEHLSNLTPSKPELYIPLGSELNAVKRYLEASSILENATVLYADNPDAWTQLAGSYAGLSRFEEALSTVRKSLQISINQSGGWEKLGTILSGQGRFYEAVAAYEKALSYDTKDVDIWTGLGDTWIALGQYTQALESYAAAAEIRPNDTPLFQKISLRFMKNKVIPPKQERFE